MTSKYISWSFQEKTRKNVFVSILMKYEYFIYRHELVMVVNCMHLVVEYLNDIFNNGENEFFKITLNEIGKFGNIN